MTNVRLRFNNGAVLNYGDISTAILNPEKSLPVKLLERQNVRMKPTHRIAKFIRVICGAGLVLVGVFWALLAVLLASAFISGGVVAARNKLHHLMFSGAMWNWAMEDPVYAVSAGYEALLFYVLLTWALREGYSASSKSLQRRSSD